jgi:7-cyano-7-deazaguanine tRNA-ribosyltransferase
VSGIKPISLIVGRSARSHIAETFEHPSAAESIFSVSDLIAKRSMRERLLHQGVHALCPVRQRVMIDSGGYQFLRTGTFPLKWNELVTFYNEIGADMGVALDRPITPKDSPADAKTIVRRNLERYVSMRRHGRRDLEIVPVLHGSTSALAEWECKALAAIDTAPPLIGLGGVVPHLVEITRNFRFGRDFTAKIELVRMLGERVLLARQYFPKSRLHVFGAGGTVSIALAIGAGAHSVDSSGWRVRAAFGCILGPWGRQLRVRSRLQSPTAFATTLKAAMTGCRCPVCGTSKRQRASLRLIHSFESRAIHNLWMQFSDLERVRAKLRGCRPASHLSAPIAVSHPLLRILREASGTQVV